MEVDNNEPEKEVLFSINDVIRNYRASHPKRNRYLSNVHVTFITSWLVLRWAVVQPAIKYINEFIEKQRNGLTYKSKR